MSLGILSFISYLFLSLKYWREKFQLQQYSREHIQQGWDSPGSSSTVFSSSSAFNKKVQVKKQGVVSTIFFFDLFARNFAETIPNRPPSSYSLLLFILMRFYKLNWSLPHPKKPHLNSLQHCNKQHFQPSMLYHIIISREQIENHLYMPNFESRYFYH